MINVTIHERIEAIIITLVKELSGSLAALVPTKFLYVGLPAETTSVMYVEMAV